MEIQTLDSRSDLPRFALRSAVNACACLRGRWTRAPPWTLSLDAPRPSIASTTEAHHVSTRWHATPYWLRPKPTRLPWSEPRDCVFFDTCARHAPAIKITTYGRTNHYPTFPAIALAPRQLRSSASVFRTHDFGRPRTHWTHCHTPRYLCCVVVEAPRGRLPLIAHTDHGLPSQLSAAVGPDFTTPSPTTVPDMARLANSPSEYG